MEEELDKRVLLKARKRKTPSKSSSEASDKDNIKTLQNLDLNEVPENAVSNLEKQIHIISDDKKMSSCCKNALVNVLNELKTERKTNTENLKSIKELQTTVTALQVELENSKQWQSSVYMQLQRMTEFNNEMSKRILELQNSQSKPYINKPNKAEVKLATKKQKAVVYGDSSCAKKLSQRRKLNDSKPIENGKPDEEEYIQTEQNQEKNLAKTQKQIETMELIEPEQKEKINETQQKESNEKHESIEETLREAAEAAILNSGYVYDETSGMYYNWNTKMYYDPSSKLYYDHINGIYYYYDQERESYIFHSQITVSNSDGNEETKDIKSSKMEEEELSDGEIRSEGSSNEGKGRVDVFVDPCIRIIVVKSETLNVGTLFMITCQGGNIGRDVSNNIYLSDEMVSRYHAKIIYEKESQTFFLQDLKTQNGTFINDERISDPKVDSDPVEITHRDYVQVGDTTMSFHVHMGNDTCFDCEPGNIKAIVEENNSKAELKEDLNVQRKQEMKSMMKKYGLSKGYIPKKLIESIPDRAGRRRQDVGSDPYENKLKPVEKASVHKEISEDNIGHKMLSKMGWKSGEGLGKSQQGIAQPIGVQLHGKHAGLGFGQSKTIDEPNSSRKQVILNKTKERFETVGN